MLLKFSIATLCLKGILAATKENDTFNFPVLSHDDPLTRVENQVTFCISMLQLNKGCGGGMADVFETTLKALENEDKKTVCSYFKKQTLEQRHQLGLIVGRLVFGFLNSNDQQIYNMALRLGHVLSSCSIPIDSSELASTILQLDLARFNLPKILDLMAVLSDFRRVYAPLILRLKIGEFSTLPFEVLFDRISEEPMPSATKLEKFNFEKSKQWKRCLKDIFRHSTAFVSKKKNFSKC